MKPIFVATAICAIALFAGIAAYADDATLHGKNLRRDGSAIRMTDFDVTLDGRLLTASEGVYHPNTGIVDLTGKVQLQFGKQAQTFPGEVK